MEILDFGFLLGIFFFILGTIVGSFLNVVVFRLGTGHAPSGRSHCLSCGRKLSASELIPILSFIILRGRCSSCKTRISFQYPLVEFLSGFIFLIIYLKFEAALATLSLFAVGQVLLSFLIASLLIAIAIYDIRHKIIPNPLVFVFIVLSIIAAFVRFTVQMPLGFSAILILDFLAGPIFFLFFYTLWKISTGRWMGLGDGKLALGIGLALGFWSGLSALILSFWIGAIVGLSLLFFYTVFSRFLWSVLPAFGLKSYLLPITMKTEIPFAPFMILGVAIVFFLNINVIPLF